MAPSWTWLWLWLLLLAACGGDAAVAVADSSGADAQVADTTADAQVADTTADTQVADTTADTQVADTTADAQVADTTADTQVADTTADAQVADTTPDAQVADTTADTQVADTTADAQVADTTPDAQVADTGPTPSADLCQLPPLASASGPVFYFCDCGAGADPGCVPGDDGADGAAPTSARRTFEAARSAFNALPAGGTVALCRGGAFTVSGTRWSNPSCRADDRCVVRDYDPGGVDPDARPLVRALNGSHVFSLEDGGDANHEEGYVIANLRLTSVDGGGWAVFAYNDVDDVRLCHLDIDGFGIGVHAAGSNPPEADSDGENENIVLEHSRVTNCADQGWLGGCSGCGVRYSVFDNNGFARAVFNHNIYFSGSNVGVAHGMFAIGNDLYRSAAVDGVCAGTSLVAHGNHDGLLIEDNFVHEDVGAAGQGCWGIAVDTGYASAESFVNVTIRGNVVADVGNLAIGVNACSSCLIENNLIISRQPYGARAIAAPDRPREANDLPMNAVTVRNNTVVSVTGGTGIAVGGDGTGHIVVSNAIVTEDTASAWNCLQLDLPASAYAAVDNNLCDYSTAPGGEWVDGHGDLASWQAASGFDAASLAADPGYPSLQGPPWALPPGSAASPLVDHGHPTLSAPTDIHGAPRDAAPDIGAWER
jgi:hypothetical protein